MQTPHWPISLAQWSLHRSINDGLVSAEDFPVFTRDMFGLQGVEYVNTFFKDRVRDQNWLTQLATRTEAAGVRNLLIMVDGAGALGAANEAARQHAVDAHHEWLQAAAALGCHSIRVNINSEGTPDEQRDRCAAGLHALLEHAEACDLDVLIENHGGLSSHGEWLVSLMDLVDHPRLGTLPDFGNFIVNYETGESYDRYKGIDELMPWARSLSAKSHDFDAEGNEVNTDYEHMFKIVRSHNYQGWVGVEYEGEHLSEVEGITRTRDLLCRHGCSLSLETSS